jgi:hypothetical protein
MLPFSILNDILAHVGWTVFYTDLLNNGAAKWNAALILSLLLSVLSLWPGCAILVKRWHDLTDGLDLCNVYYIRENILGRTLLGMDVHDARRALDDLCDQDFVNPDKIGVMGLSFGGTMTVWTSICDERIKAADVICYSDLFADFTMRCAQFCGSQITTGLYELCDVPDLQGLISPRPLLVEIGSNDNCFYIDSAMQCFHKVEAIYDAAGIRNHLDLDLFDGGHVWGGNKSIEFFRRWLS